MPSSYTALYYHAIFSTKHRRPQIVPELRSRLFAYMGGILQAERSRLLAAGGPADHVHLLVSLHSQLDIADAMRLVKANSSKWIHETFPGSRDFGWQDGYGAFTVSHSNLDDVKSYLAGQEAHHRQETFQEEFIKFLERHHIPYDERYIWE